MNWAQIIILACAAAVYPTLLTGVILILTRPNPLRMLVGFLAGGLLISVGAGIAIYTAFKTSGAVGTSHRETKPVADIVIGASSLLIAWGVATNRITGSVFRRRRRRSSKPKKPGLSARALSRGSVPMAVAAGLVLNLPGVWYLDALAEMARARPSTTSAILAMLVFNLIMFVLVEFPMIAYVVNPEGAKARVNHLSRLAHEHAREIGLTVAAAAGVYLIIKGIVNLT